VQSLGNSKTVSHGPEGTKVIIVINIRKKTSYPSSTRKKGVSIYDPRKWGKKNIADQCHKKSIWKNGGINATDIPIRFI
jgi:hypothetical protein